MASKFIAIDLSQLPPETQNMAKALAEISAESSALLSLVETRREVIVGVLEKIFSSLALLDATTPLTIKQQALYEEIGNTLGQMLTADAKLSRNYIEWADQTSAKAGRLLAEMAKTIDARPIGEEVN